ncbi:sodium channel protein 60E-like isoform X2 [Dendronephthya gigantea]|uniref:sodium channel protein 60E-like isoform X2 n=1 Tax=Dendronephthya gigantea TaxID=151771 RepID=UPI00106DC304|nr:sodium channel protein 60E-like isoform X2 [Dendronephthya gigantea]
MSIPDKRKSRSTTIFEGENETSQEHNSRSVTKLPTGILGVPLVDHDLPGDETFVVIARRFGKQIVYRFNKQKSLCLFSPRSSLRQFVIFLTTNQYFELFILVLIIINCILLAFKDQPEEVEYVFAALYTMEMILKIIGKGFCLHKFAYLRDPWNWLDFIVVILGYLTMAPSVANLSGIRTFRVLRALRTISVIEGLRTMVNAFLRSMRMLTDVLGLSLFFISIFALVGMQLFVGVLRNKCVLNPGVNVSDFDAFVANESNWLFVDDDPVVCGNGSTARSCPANYTCFSDIGDNPNHGYTSFDTFPWALLCTVQLVTADYWENVYEYIIASTGFWSVFYFLLVIFFGSFYILNLILAVVALSYQQEMANLKNKEADFHKLKTTSSSYSLHESFKAQKLFPTKPLNLSSIRRRSTKTSPYVGVSAASPGPYHPSSPDDGNIAELSPLTLDKVTPYAFDNESVASFYNYEPSVMEEIRNGSKHNLDKDKDFRENEGICYDKKIDGSDPNGKEKMEEISISVEKQNIERILEKPHFDEPRSLDTRQKGKKRNANDTGVQIHAKKCVKSPYTKITAKGNLNSPNRSENNATNNLKEKSSQRNENMSTVTENPITYLTEKTKLSETASKSNENDRNEVYSRSIESPLQSKVTGESRTRQSVDHSEHFELDRIGDKHSGLNGTNSNSQFEKNSEYVLNKQSDHEDTNGIPRERSDMMIDIPKSVSKRTSCATTLAWEGSPRLKSIDRGLMIAQETGLMIVQTSSLCVVIPRETGQDHRLFNAIRRKCASFIVHPMFDWFITSVIFLNTIALAVEHHGMNRKFEKALDNINLTCTFVFILEMFLKVTALSLQGYIQSRWNILDGLIIVISVVELLIVWCVPDITHGLGFSVLRTFRLVRILKLAQSWVTMRALLSTIGASIGQLGNLTLLLAIVTYTFAVIGMQLFSGSFTPEHFEDRKVPRWNFGDFLHSFMIIFRVLCGEWIEPLVMTMHVTTPTSVVFYFAVLIIGNFLILNLFLALLLNSFSTESLNSGKRTRGSANIRERFRTLMKKYLNVMRAFRAPRVSAEHETKSERHTENEGGLRSDAVRECECEIARSGVEIDDNHHIPKKFSVSSRSEVVDETCSRTQSRDTWMTSSEHSPKPFVPDCFPKFCCMCFGEEKARRSLAFKAFVLSRGKVLSVVKHKYFDAFILFVILISSMSLALEDIHLDSKPDLKAFLKMFNLVVAVIFVLEFLLKLFAFGFVHYFRDAWNCLDFFIVVVSIVSLVGSAGDGNLTAFRSLRTLRALRPLRAIPRWKGMKVVVNSLLSAIPEIGNVSLVCSIFWLIFSVMGVQFFGGKFYKCLDEDGDILPHTTVPDKNSCLAMNYTWKNSDINFDNSIAGFLALFQVATFEGWIEVMADAADVTEVDQQPERDKNHIAHLYFVVFVLFGSFFVLNLFVGVIIDNFNRLKKEYESGAVGLFLTETQRAWYDTLKKAARKKPRKVTKRPKMLLAREFSTKHIDVVPP